MAELGDLLPIAVGIVVSPLEIVAVVALLATTRGRSNGSAFAGAYIAVGVAVTAVAVVGARGATRGNDEAHRTLTTVLAAGLAVVFLVLAVLAWRGRPRGGRDPSPPRWLAAVDTMTPVLAAGLGLVLAATDGKNIGLQLRAGSVIDGLDAGVGVLLAVAVAFALISGLGVLVPVVVAVARPVSALRWLTALRDDLVRHASVIMTVLFAVLAAVQAGHVVEQL